MAQDPSRLTRALDGFAEQLRGQCALGSSPTSEHTIHFCIALGFQSTLDLAPGMIGFERRLSGNAERTDLWVGPPPGTALEVKFNRPPPGGRNRPFTQLYGLLLADVNKLAQVQGSLERILVLVADAPSVLHMAKSGKGLLPLVPGERAVVSAGSVSRLSKTAQVAALTHGYWAREIRVEMIWHSRADEFALAAWSVTPPAPPGATVMVPSADASISDIWSFALTFDGYGRHPDPVNAVAMPAREEWRHSGALPADLATARLALFGEQRRAHWSDVYLTAEDETYLRGLIWKIRELGGASVERDDFVV